MRRIPLPLSSFATAFILAILLPGASVASAAFVDVQKSHPNADAIDYVSSEGIMPGFSDATFGPDEEISREDFVGAVVNHVFSKEFIDQCFTNISSGSSSEYTLLFLDVAKEGDAAKRICAAMMANVVHGYPDGLFRPLRPINVAEASKVLSRAYDVALLPYRDRGNLWFRLYVDYLAEHAVIPPTLRSFTDTVTRSEAAEMIYRIDARITDKPSMSFQDLANAAWDAVVGSLTRLFL